MDHDNTGRTDVTIDLPLELWGYIAIMANEAEVTIAEQIEDILRQYIALTQADEEAKEAEELTAQFEALLDVGDDDSDLGYKPSPEQRIQNAVEDIAVYRDDIAFLEQEIEHARAEIEARAAAVATEMVARGGDRDDPPRFTYQMAERGRKCCGGGCHG